MYFNLHYIKGTSNMYTLSVNEFEFSSRIYLLDELITLFYILEHFFYIHKNNIIYKVIYSVNC